MKYSRTISDSGLRSAETRQSGTLVCVKEENEKMFL
jgi:hypothetical protein